MKRRSFLIGLAAARPALSELSWPEARPAALGFNPSRLEAARENLANRNTKALLILRGGRVALEWYAPGMSASSKHYTASMAKAIVGGVSLLVTMSDGRIRAGDRAAQFIPG